MDGPGYAPGWDPATVRDFEALVAPLSNWGRWGEADQAGTANLLTQPRVARSAGEVRSGRVVPLGRPLSPAGAPDDPRPMQHHMLSSGEGAPTLGGRHASDWFGLAYHGFAVTHLDAPSHQLWGDRMYNDRPASLVSTRSGAATNSVEPLAAGLVGRGVLLDAPRALGVGWLEPGTGLGPAELDRIASHCEVTPAPGDLVLVRTGRDARAAMHGVVHPMIAGSAGLHAAALAWLRAADVAVLGSDTAHDVMVPGLAAHPMPIHAGALAFLGLPLLDNLLLEGLAEACAGAGRWTFQLVVAPLALVRATGSPVNPVAIL